MRVPKRITYPWIGYPRFLSASGIYVFSLSLVMVVGSMKPETKYASTLYYTVSIIICRVRLLGKSLYGFMASSATVIGCSNDVYPKKATAAPFMTPNSPLRKKGVAFLMSNRQMERTFAY